MFIEDFDITLSWFSQGKHSYCVIKIFLYKCQWDSSERISFKEILRYTIDLIKMNKYLQLATVGTSYANRMNRLSNRIFGEVVRQTNKKSLKVVKLFSEKPVQKRPEIVDYYPRHKDIQKLMSHLRDYGLFRDEHEDFKEEYDRLRELRGKRKWVPPHLRK
ncbi:hypothetical protein M0802_008683 [Mischocyttarus mexicanus]|nr:hypothetical protein M0802_008683 [Mischocyttarus mexicanus]